MSTYLITGTSRGIGLELTKQLSELPSAEVSKIFAVTRGPSAALQKVIDSSSGRVVNVVIDNISSETSVSQAAQEVEKLLGGKGLDVLVNNAGMMPFTPEGVKSLTSDSLKEVYDVNVVSAQVMSKIFLPLLQKGKDKKIMNISTSMGSITRARDYSFATTHAYKITKAAMNMLTAQWAMELESERFTVLAITPGWLKTDLGSEHADLDVSVGVESVKNIILNAKPSDNGKFQNIHVTGWEKVNGPNFYDGKEVPW